MNQIKETRLKVYAAPVAEELRFGQMYGICQESPAPGSNEGVSYEEWSL